MRSLKVALFAGATFAAAFTSAQAADLGPIMQPRPIAPVQVEEMTGGWYLRGDIGVGAQDFKSFDFTPDQLRASCGRRAGASIRRKSATRSSSAAASAIQWNSWLRFDATGRIPRQDQVQDDRQLHRVLPGRPLLRRL